MKDFEDLYGKTEIGSAEDEMFMKQVDDILNSDDDSSDDTDEENEDSSNEHSEDQSSEGNS